MRIHYDLEFHDQGRDEPIRLISIGMIREDGHKLYAVNADMDTNAVRADPWLRKNVWRHLPLTSVARGERGMPTLDRDDPDVRPLAQISEMVRRFVLSADNPELWAYYSSHDHVVMTSQLFGRMTDLPTGFPMRTNDLAQVLAKFPTYVMPTTYTPEHHAFADARNLALACSELL